MDGLEVARRLKDHPETADIPVLLASVSLLGREEVKLADGFLVKPYQMDILFPYVKKLLRSSPERPA